MEMKKILNAIKAFVSKMDELDHRGDYPLSPFSDELSIYKKGEDIFLSLVPLNPEEYKFVQKCGYSIQSNLMIAGYFEIDSTSVSFASVKESGFYKRIVVSIDANDMEIGVE